MLVNETSIMVFIVVLSSQFLSHKEQKHLNSTSFLPNDGSEDHDYINDLKNRFENKSKTKRRHIFDLDLKIFSNKKKIPLNL